MKKRIDYYDIAKGILILLLPIHHYHSAKIRCFVATDYDFLIEDWQYLVASFFMVAFFVISGMCSNFNKSNKQFLTSLVRGIAVPYVVISVIQLFSYLLFEGSIERFVNSYAKTPNTTLWFLVALCGGKMILYYLLKINRDIRFVLSVTFLMMLLGIFLNSYRPQCNYFAIYHSLISAFFISFGLFMKENKMFYKYALKVSVYIFIITLLYQWQSWQRPNFTYMINIQIHEIPLFLLTSLSGTCFVLKISKMVDCSKKLEFVGRNSLIIYGLHFIFLLRMMPFLFNHIHPDTSIYLFLVFVVILYVLEYLYCIFLAYIFSETKAKKLLCK